MVSLISNSLDMYVFESSRSYADCIRLVASGMGIIVQRIPEDFRSKRMLILVKDFEGYETFREYVSPGRNIRVCLDTLKEGKYSFNIYSYQEDLYWPFFSCVGPVFRKDASGCVFLSTPFAVYDSLVVSSWPTDPGHLQNYLIPTDQFQTWDMEIAKLAQELSVRYLTTYAKMKAVHDYVAGNIAYDYDSLRSGEYASQDHSALGTLHRGRSVCQGYASLSVALLRAMGIPARLAKCHTLGGPEHKMQTDEDGRIGMVDHVITAAFVSSRWSLMDVTWNSNLKHEGGKTSCCRWCTGHRYFDMTPSMLSLTHKLAE